MVEGFSLKTAHYFGDALASQARLRHRVFVEQRRLDHPSWERMEYDAFDTPAAMYFVWRDDGGEARGLIRLLPTVMPYMLETHWPHLIQDRELPRSPKVWEVTRLCVDRHYAADCRLVIMPEIMCAVHEFCQLMGIETVIGVTRKHLIEHFLRKGVEWLGPTEIIEGQPEAAFRVDTRFMRPEWHCRKYHLNNISYLSLEPEAVRRIAA